MISHNPGLQTTDEQQVKDENKVLKVKIHRI